MQKTYYFVLIIYILSPWKLFSQELHLKINGQSIYETQVIDSLNYSAIHKNFESVAFEVDSIQKLLFKKGYIENELKKMHRKNDSTYLAEFHLKKKFNTIYIYYKNLMLDKSSLNFISDAVFDDYFVLNFNTVENALSFINNQIVKQGLPFSKLKLENIKVSDNQNLIADLVIDADKNPRVINAIEVKGYEKFPKSYIKHYLKIKRQQVFDLDDVNKRTKKLNDLNFANQIKAPEILFSKDSTTLYMYLEKTKSNTFDGFLGFGTNNDTGNLEFDGYLNLNLTNNLNFGESFRLLYKSDEIDQQTFKADVALPYLFKSPIGLDLQLQIFKKDSSFTTANQSIKLHYQINSKHKIYGGLVYSESNNLLDIETATTITDYKTNYYSFAYQYANPQNFNLLFPINSGYYLETNFGERQIGNQTQSQSLFLIDAFKIFNLNTKNSLYFKVNGGALISDTYLENELLRFGGINSIRGFEENSLFASLYGVLNTEYRFQLSNSFYVNSIFDASYFENKVSNTKEKLFGFGFGFGILTKAGIFKFNYANGKLENQKFKLSNSKIHISLTTNF